MNGINNGISNHLVFFRFYHTLHNILRNSVDRKYNENVEYAIWEKTMEDSISNFSFIITPIKNYITEEINSEYSSTNRFRKNLYLEINYFEVFQKKHETYISNSLLSDTLTD